MSQTAPGENGSSGEVPHSSRQIFQQPFPAPHGPHFLPQGQGRPQWEPYVHRVPVKPTNPYEASGFRPGFPVPNYNAYSSHVMPQHFHVVRTQNDCNVRMWNPHQQNHCGNVQYLQNGSYVTSFTVNQNIENQEMHSVQHQYIQNAQYINPNHALLNTFNTNYSGYSIAEKHYGETPSTHENVEINKSPEMLPSDKQSLAGSESISSVSDSPDNCSQTLNSEVIHERNNNFNTHDSGPCITGGVNSFCHQSNGRNLLPQHPRSISRDSLRSETTESSCSSVSSDVSAEQNLTPANNPLPSNEFSNSHSLLSENQASLHTPHVFSQTTVNNCQNSISNKNVPYNSSMVQTYQQFNTVQHFHVHRGDVQMMQQYQSIPNPEDMPYPMDPTPNSGHHQNSSNFPQENGVMLANEVPILNTAIPPNKLTNSCNATKDNFKTSNPIGAANSNSPGITIDDVSLNLKSNVDNFPEVPHTDVPVLVVVPFGWRRLVDDGKIVYISPCGSELRSEDEVRHFLMQEGTCKCGLQCPLKVENVFCFDAKVSHRLTMPGELSMGQKNESCSHRRKLDLAFSRHLQKQAKKEDGRKKRKRKMELGPMQGKASAPSNSMVPGINTVAPGVNFQAMSYGSPGVQMQRPPIQNQNFSHHYGFDQNWNGAYIGPRHINPAMTGPCPININHNVPNNRNITQGCAPTTFQYGNYQQPQNCYENTPPHLQYNQIPQCMNTFPQNNEMMLRPIRPGFNVPNRPSFYRYPSNAPIQNFMDHHLNSGCADSNYMHQQFVGPQNRLPMPNSVHNFNYRMPQVINMSGHGSSEGSKVTSGFRLEGKEKRRRASSSSRSRKKVKANAEASTSTNNLEKQAGKSDNISSTFPGQKTSGNSTTSGQNEGQILSYDSGPSFMDDPNGYLAQQTALLNNTMSGGGVGQFSPPEEKTALPAISFQSGSNPPSSSQNTIAKTSSVIANKQSKESIVVALPSNVPLPAKVGKTTSNLGFSAVASSLVTSSSTTTTVSTSSAVSLSIRPKLKYVHSSEIKELIDDQKNDDVKTDIKSCERNSNLTVTSKCDTDEIVPILEIPNSSQSLRRSPENVTCAKFSTKGLVIKDREIQVSVSNNSSHTIRNKTIAKKSTGSNKTTHCDSLNSSASSKDSSSGSIISSGMLSLEAANKPLALSPVESTSTTQSPLEMVQNIVSSIPLPASPEVITSQVVNKSNQVPLSQHSKLDQTVINQRIVNQNQVICPQVFNMTNASNVAGVVYNPNNSNANVLRGAGPIVVHGATGSIPQGVLVSNSNVVVVTSPFNTKVSIASTAVPSDMANLSQVVGMQTPQQVHLQQPLTSVTPQVPAHLQSIQSVQPVVQLVNPFTAVQTPVIIQNGTSIIQSSSGVLPHQGGVIAPASLVPSNGPTFIAGQQLLTVDTSHSTSSVHVAQVVASSTDISDGSSSSLLTPVSTPATTPTTPHSTFGSDTPPSGGSNCSSGGGRKKKRKRNTSTPQGSLQPQALLSQQNLVPTIIMGKQLPSQQVMMNGSQIPQVASYPGTQMATVATVGTASGQLSNSQASHILSANGQSANSINVVQMVGNALTGTLPVQVQQPHTILVPSTPATGVVINQLPDGSFVTTDPNSGMTYPVQIQLSGSQVIGVNPLPNNLNSNTRSNMMASISVRQPLSQANTVIASGPKLINISPSPIAPSQSNVITSNVFHLTSNSSILTGTSCGISSTHSVTTPVQPVYVEKGNTTHFQLPHKSISSSNLPRENPFGTHSSVSTQTLSSTGVGESDVSSSDGVALVTPGLGPPRSSPTDQSAEVTTTKLDEDPASTPESLVVSPESPRTKHFGNSSEHRSASSSEFGENIVFWGFHRGHHYWPAQIQHKNGGEATVEWYGDHMVEKVPFSSLSQFGKNILKITTRRSNRDRRALEEAIQEASLSIRTGTEGLDADCLPCSASDWTSPPRISSSSAANNMDSSLVSLPSTKGKLRRKTKLK